MSTATSLTIVVPSFNQGRYISQTLDSILSQDIPGLQVVVADGASKDETVAVLRDYAARHPAIEWISEADKGPADAVNKGFARARGEIVGIQSSDDLYVPGALAAALEVFRAHPDVGLMWGEAQAISPTGDLLASPRAPGADWRSLFASRLAIPQSSTFFRRTLLTQTHGWDGQYYSCDLEFWLRLLFRTKPMKLNRVLSQWRVHPEQRTRPGQGILEGYARTIQDSTDLRATSIRLRRYAQGSIHIMALDIPSDARAVTLWRHALLAVLLFPEFLRHRQWRRFAARLPGLGWLRPQRA